MLELPKRQMSKESNSDSNYLFRFLSHQSTRNTGQEQSQYTRFKSFGSFLGIKECHYCNSDEQESEEMSKLLMLCANRATIQHEFYNVKSINSILYNRQAHIVSVFKDYLIQDDVCEFITTFYDYETSKQKINKLASDEIQKQQQFRTISYIPIYHNLDLKQLLNQNLRLKKKTYEDQIKFQALTKLKQEKNNINLLNIQSNNNQESVKRPNILKFEKLLKSSLLHEYNFTSIVQSSQYTKHFVESSKSPLINQFHMSGNGSNDINEQLQQTLSLSKLSFSQELLNDNSDKIKDNVNYKRFQEEQKYVFLNNSNSLIKSFELDGDDEVELPLQKADTAIKKIELFTQEDKKLKKISSEVKTQDFKIPIIQKLQNPVLQLNDLESKIRQRYLELDQKDSIIFQNSQSISSPYESLKQSAFQLTPLMTKIPKQKLVVKTDNRIIPNKIPKIKQLNKYNLQINEATKLNVEPIAEFELSDSPTLPIISRNFKGKHLQSLSNMSSLSSVIIDPMQIQTPQNNMDRSRNMNPMSGIITKDNSRIIQGENQNTSKLSLGLDKNRIIRKNNKFLNNIVLKRRENSLGGGLQIQPSESINILQGLESARNPISSFLFGDKSLINSQINSRNKLNESNKNQTTNNLQDRFIGFNIDDISQKNTQSIFSSIIQQNLNSGSQNFQPDSIKKTGILQKLKISKKPIVTLKKNKFEEQKNSLMQSFQPSPYQKPFPIPIQGSLRKNKIEKSGILVMKRRNNSYGGSPAVTELKMPSIIPINHKQNVMIHQKKKSIYCNSNITNNDDIIIQDQRNSIVQKPPMAKNFPLKKLRESTAIQARVISRPNSQMEF